MSILTFLLATGIVLAVYIHASFLARHKAKVQELAMNKAMSKPASPYMKAVPASEGDSSTEDAINKWQDKRNKKAGRVDADEYDIYLNPPEVPQELYETTGIYDASTTVDDTRIA